MMRYMFIAAISLIMAGCSTLENRQDLDQAVNCGGNPSPRVLAEGTAIGAVGGAALGAGTGYLASRDAAVGASIGAGVGAIAGLIYALNVENEYQDAQCKEKILDQAIGVAQRLNEMSQAINDNLSFYLKNLSEKIRLVERRKKQRATELEQMEVEKVKLKEIQTTVARGIAATEKVLGALKGWALRSAIRSEELSAETSRLEAQNETLRGHASALAALGQRI